MNKKDITLDIETLRTLLSPDQGGAHPSASTLPPVGSLVIVRASGAGCHFGTLAAVDSTTVRLTESRRIWQWQSDDQRTLSDLATSGDVTTCKLGPPVEVSIAGWHELLAMDRTAADRLVGRNEWSS